MDSPFQDILHTNLVPSDLECQRIRDLLADPQREVDHLTEELARLDSLREEISAKRRHLQQFIDVHRAMLAPMRRLPQDILRGIFMACLSSTRNPAISSAEAPLLLCLICQSWRSIALATPRLWASIHIVVPNRLRLQHIVDRVAVWLKWSGAVPLDISMVLSRTCGDDWDISPLLSSLVAVSRRWRTIEIPLPEDVSPLLSVVAEDVPLLQTVKIIRWDRSTASASSCSSFAFLAAQGLRSLTLPASQYSHENSVSWKFLTHLDFSVSNDYLTCTAALIILQQCTALQTCELAIKDSWADDDPLTEPFSLPQLSHLSLSRPGSISLRHFFGSVTLPNLRSLHYERYGSGGDHETHLARLLPSTPSLECLQIFAIRLRSSALLDVLSHVPMLKELLILQEPWKDSEDPSDPWANPRDGNFLKHLTLAPGLDPVVCPGLEFIELGDFKVASDEMLLRFVQSRTNPQLRDVARLSHVVAELDRPMDSDILPDLQDAIAAGLIISLSYHTAQSSSIHSYSPLEGTDDFAGGGAAEGC